MSAAYICIIGGVNLDVTNSKYHYFSELYVSRVHLKGIVSLIWIVRKRIVVSSLRLSRYQFFLSTELQQRSLQKLRSSYDGFSLNRVNLSSVIPQSKWNQSVADGCNERHFILVLDQWNSKKKDKERKETNKNLIF